MYSTLRPERPAAAQVLLARLEQLLGRRRAAVEEVEDPAVDRPRRFRRELLADDRPQQRPVGVGRAAPRSAAAAGSRGRSRRSARSAPPSRARRRPAPCVAFALTGPVQSGLRFSANAWIPSRKSSEPKHDSRRATAPPPAAAVRTGLALSTSIACLLPRIESGALAAIVAASSTPAPSSSSSAKTSWTRPISLGPLGFDVAPGQEQLLGPRQPDRVEELAEAGVAVDQAQFRRRHAELRPGRADPHVAGDRQLEAAAEAVAVDHRHRRPGMGGERLHRGVEGVGDEGLGVALEGLFGDRRRCRSRRRRPAARR